MKMFGCVAGGAKMFKSVTSDRALYNIASGEATSQGFKPEQAISVSVCLTCSICKLLEDVVIVQCTYNGRLFKVVNITLKNKNIIEK